MCINSVKLFLYRKLSLLEVCTYCLRLLIGKIYREMLKQPPGRVLGNSIR